MAVFGKIISIDENRVVLENALKQVRTEYMNFHVVFEGNVKTVGEIIKINENEIEVLLIGEIVNDMFTPGVNKKPASIPRIINVHELELIIGKQVLTNSTLLVGNSNIYKNYNIFVNVNDIFANHLAIFGNTGSGKSCSAASLLQNLFYNYKPVNSHFFIFDPYGEYNNAFSNINKNGLHSKVLTTIHKEGIPILKIPTNFLEVDDLAVLLSVTDSDQIPVLEKTLKLVYIFAGEGEKNKEYKNDIIAKCLLDILTSGKSSSQMRDQIIAVLSHFSTDELNLNSIIKQPGYDRTLFQCLFIDDQGKMNAILNVTEFLKQFVKVDIEQMQVLTNFTYSLKDLYYALEFALISEGTLNSGIRYDKNNILKTRLQSIINNDYKDIFESTNYMSKEDYVKSLFSTETNEKAQVVSLDLSNVDDRFAKVLTKILSKIFFTYTTSLDYSVKYPINIILEEAHRYVQNDLDLDIIGYNIFDRITKEGRKYGCFLTLISQRPSEVSQTCLSQCSNFMVFRIFHPKDFNIVRDINTNVTIDQLNILKTLKTGSALCFGLAFKTPLLAMFNLPDPLPRSSSLKIDNIWYEE